jgi:hypothetical protein
MNYFFLATDIRLRRKMPSDSPESNSKKNFGKKLQTYACGMDFFCI